MQILRGIYRAYRQVEPHIFYAIAVQFSIQIVNTAFFLLLNYYMAAEGYADHEIANVLAFRFLAVFWLAFPVGLFIKGRQLKPFFWAATIGIPLLSHLLLLAIDRHWDDWINILAMAWGVAYMCVQVTILPYILLNGRPDRHSEAFSLSFLSFSGTTFLIGAAYYLLQHLDPVVFNEKHVLQFIATLSLAGIYFAGKIKPREQLSYKVPFREIGRKYDWKIIAQALTPTFIIAVGAGFTIPVINLFFLNVHGMPSGTFSILGAVTYFAVFCVMPFMPYIKRNFGYRTAITLFQTLAVFALFMLATTEFYKEWSIAIYVAIFFYVVRQPLMNAAGPMTSELMMYYVGKRNQEIISALNASIWSGSWFVSMKLFGLLRRLEYPYVTIFLITVGLYAVGVAWYAVLIRRFERRQKTAARQSSSLVSS